MNFVKNKALKMWILSKMSLWKCEFMEKWRIFCPSVLIKLASLAVNKWYYQEGTNKLHFLKSRKPPLDNSLTSKACSSAWWWCGAVDGWDWYPPISCTVSALQRDSRQETWVVVYAQREYQNTSWSREEEGEAVFRPFSFSRAWGMASHSMLPSSSSTSRIPAPWERS